MRYHQNLFSGEKQDILEIVKLFAKVNVAKLGEYFKAKEAFAQLKVEPPIVIRLDGVGFGRALEGFEKPRSRLVHEALVEACMGILDRFGCNMGYVVSDELNVVCLDSLPYGGRVEKLNSISAAIASAITTLKLRRPLFFDARIVELSSKLEAKDYILFRARVGLNNFIAQFYHAKHGHRRQTPRLEQMVYSLQNELRNIELWKPLGTCIRKEVYTKRAIDRKHGNVITVTRRRWRISEGPLHCLENI